MVPVYVLGANDVYTRHFGPTSLAAKLSKKLRMSLVFWTDAVGFPYGVVPCAGDLSADLELMCSRELLLFCC